jgi:hypothetical protein
VGNVTNEQEDARDLALVHQIPVEARRWIQHHFGNALAGAMGMLHLGRYDEAMEALDHAVADLRRITPPEERERFARINQLYMKQQQKT